MPKGRRTWNIVSVTAKARPVEEIRPGDIVFTPSDEWHWHGAAPDHFMAHFSITEGTGDSDTAESTWGDHVADAEYGTAPNGDGGHAQQ